MSALAVRATNVDSRAPVLHARALTKRFGRRTALANVDLDVARGTVFGMIGADGAGKTSVIQILAGVLEADGGVAEVGGIDVRRNPEGVKARIGYMPQGLGANLYDRLTVAENLEFFRRLRGVGGGESSDQEKRLLSMTRLSPFLARPAAKLSGGMRQKLALICSLLHAPEILLLDEPTTGVDPLSRRDFWSIIESEVTARGVTVLLATSYMDEAERCGHVALVHGGRIIASGPPTDLPHEFVGRIVALPAEVGSERVARTPGVATVSLFGRKIHAVLDETGAPEQISRALDLPAESAVELRPTLEDLFVQRLGGAHVAAPKLPPRVGSRPEGTVSVEALTCAFGSFVAVDSVTLLVPSGEIIGLLGPNGAGKTTLIRVLCGLQRPTSGSATVAGVRLPGSREALSRRFGYMAQRFALYGDMSPTQNLATFAGLYGLARREATDRVDALLSTLRLDDAADRPLRSLPIGYRQRVALAVAVLHDPPVLFLDEPTSGVDPIARRDFWTIVHGLARERKVTVVVSTHYMDEAEHCDRVALMAAGKLVACASPRDLRAEARSRAGAVVSVEADGFAATLAALRPEFPSAALHGRHVRWSAPDAPAAAARAAALLDARGLPHAIDIVEPTMEDAFAFFMDVSNAHH
jgi:ABC-type multidrug transport system ATPase subunit